MASGKNSSEEGLSQRTARRFFSNIIADRDVRRDG